MKPTPRKLVLAMSIAGLGASLGGAAHARSDADATSLSAGLAAAVGLPLPAVGMPADSFRVRVDGLPPTLALPLDVISGVTGTGTATTKRRLACVSVGVAPVAVPRSLWGARRGALGATTYGRPEAHAVAVDRPAQTVTGGAESVACGNAPVRDDPARHTVVDGFRLRPPKAPPAKRTWDALGAPGDDPGANHPARDRAGDGSISDAATPAQWVLEALALHRLAADASTPQVDIDPGVSGGVRPAHGKQQAMPVSDAAGGVDLPIEIDPVNEPGTIAATHAAPTTVGVDIALDLELDFYMRSIAASGSDSPRTTSLELAPTKASPGAGSERTAIGANPHAGTTEAHRDQAAAVIDLELDLQPPTVGGIVDEASATDGDRRALGADAPGPSVAVVSERAAGVLDLDLDQPAGTALGAPTAFLDLNLDLPHVALDLDLDLPATVPGLDRPPAEMSLEINIELDLGLAGVAAQVGHETVMQAPATAGFSAAAIAPASSAAAAPVVAAVASNDDATAQRQAHQGDDGRTDVGSTASRFDAALQDASLVPPLALTSAVPSEAVAVAASARGVGGTRSAETPPDIAAASLAAAARQVPIALPQHSGSATAMPGGILVGLPEPATRSQPTTLGDMVALGETRLDEVRGGFQTSDGLQVSLGIERAVYINGNLVTTPNLNVVELTPGAGVRPVSISEVGASGVTLVQHGAGNTFVPGALSTATGTVIQNTLDGQTIRSITSINATVNSLEIMRARNFESSMRGAIVDSLRR